MAYMDASVDELPGADLPSRAERQLKDYVHKEGLINGFGCADIAA